jgi:cobalt-zinc-cadmium efflux system outer membrane protein
MTQGHTSPCPMRIAIQRIASWTGLLLAGAGGILVGQTPSPTAGLGLGQVYRAVEAANPRIGAAAALAQAADARIAPARRPPDPQLQFGLMNRSLRGFGLADPLGMNQVQLMQMVPFPGKLRMAGQVASARAEAESARATDVSWDVRARAAMAFYELYRMDHSLQVAGETLRILEDLATTARTMYGVGAGRQTDVLRAQVEIARMSEDITRMQTERIAAAARLNALLVLDPSAPVGSPVRPSFPDTLPPLDSLIAEAGRNRPMVEAAAAELLAADAGVRLARREIWPDLQVGIQYGQRPMDGGTDRMVSLMLGVNVPIFAGSRQLAMRREAAAMRQMAAADLEAMRADTRGRVAELYAGAERARRLGDLYRGTILPQAHTTVASALAAYRVGGVDFMTLLDDQMTVNRYRQDLFALEAERGRALAELEMLLSRPLFNPDHALVASGGTR